MSALWGGAGFELGPARLTIDAKRAFDVTCAVALVVLLTPLMLLVACAIKLESRGPVFHRVRRVGYGGEIFAMLKFRKMHADASGGPLTTRSDPRLTRVGALLTATRLDELPQIWHVLCGQMSLIGPRPEDPGFVSLHRHEYGAILRVRPGITGIAQLAFASERDILDPRDPVGDYIRRILPAKLHLDALYASRQSLRGDITILLWTARSALTGCQVAVDRGTAALSRRLPRPEFASARVDVALEAV